MSLYDNTTLVADEDLTNWESSMPALALKTGVYTGKRTLAKNFIAKQLLKRGLNPADIVDPSQLKDAACFKELELMFRDASTKNDAAAAKAEYYAELFADEMELILLKLSDGTVTAPTISSIPCYRA